MSSNIDNVIVDYVLDPQYPQRLKVAVELNKNYANIKRAIILDFSRRLKRSLEERFPEYAVKSSINDSTYSQSSWAGISMCHPGWTTFRVEIQAQKKDYRSFIIGVPGKEESLSLKLYSALHELYQPGRSSSQWSYFRFLGDDEFRDWDNETLIKLRDENTVKWFVEQFGMIVEIVGDVLSVS